MVNKCTCYFCTYHPKLNACLFKVINISDWKRKGKMWKLASIILVLMLYPSQLMAQSQKPVIITLVGARATDAMLTWDLAHRYGGKEMNPLMPQDPKLIVGLMSIETVIQSWALVKVNKRHPIAARFIGWASIAVEGFVIVHNARQYQ